MVLTSMRNVRTEKTDLQVKRTFFEALKFRCTYKLNSSPTIYLNTLFVFRFGVKSLSERSVRTEKTALQVKRTFLKFRFVS